MIWAPIVIDINYLQYKHKEHFAYFLAHNTCSLSINYSFISPYQQINRRGTYYSEFLKTGLINIWSLELCSSPEVMHIT